jgi:hypothetical protein
MAAFSFGIRRRLNAAAVITNSQSTLTRPRSFTFRIPPPVFIQPKGRSTQGHFFWLIR